MAQAWPSSPLGGLWTGLHTPGAATAPDRKPPWRLRLRLPGLRASPSPRAAADAAISHKFYVTCSPGLEEVVAAELRGPMIGATRVQPGSAGVAFTGSRSTGYRANLWLRCGVRVLMELASGPLPRSQDPVYQFVREAVDWADLLVTDGPPTPELGDGAGAGARLKKQLYMPWKKRPGTGTGSRVESLWKFRTFVVQSRVWSCAGLDNSMVASVRAKDAICDACRDACKGARPEAPGEAQPPDVPLFLSLYRDQAVLYRDMSGASLHKRGYRTAMHKASLNEGIAASMLMLAGWNKWLPGLGGEANKSFGGDGDLVLLDPMCGSGTLLIEAALMAVNSAPGIARTAWPFQNWHDFDSQAWRRCSSTAKAAEVPVPKGMRLLGNDIHEGALSLCSKDAETAGVWHLLELTNKDCRSYEPRAAPSLVVVNPPWGNRLGDTSSEESDWLLETWRALGRFLKSKCSNRDAYVLSGNAAVTQALHMRADKKWPLVVGGMEARLLHYHVLPPKAQTMQTLGQSEEPISELIAFSRVPAVHALCRCASVLPY